MPNTELWKRPSAGRYGLYLQSEMDAGNLAISVEQGQCQHHPNWLRKKRWMDAGGGGMVGRGDLARARPPSPPHLAQEVLQVAGASGVGGLVKMLADAIVTFQQDSITPRLAAAKV